MAISSDTYRQRSRILIEILRISVVALRNLAGGRRWLIGRRAMMIEWSELCHNIPPLLYESSDDAAYRWFIEVQGRMFLARYPRKRDADYLHVAELIGELEVLLRDGEKHG